MNRALSIAGLLLVLDQATKVAAEWFLSGRDAIPVIPGCFNLVYVTNRGAAWGMFSGLTGGRWWLLLISIVVTVIILWQFRLLTEGRWERVYALGMVLSGIFGNGIDRIWRGEVVDFADFYAGRWHWPAFNVADSSICIGVSIFVISTMLYQPAATDSTIAPSS